MDSRALIQARLFALADPEYKRFHCSLVPNLPPEVIIGVRTPALRALAKELRGTQEGAELIQNLPHEYYEENNLHGMLLEPIADYELLVAQLDRFLPHVDNWATCDCISPRLFKKRPEGLEEKAAAWMASSHTYTVRFGIGVFMSHYLDRGFSKSQPQAIASVISDEYYINMMIAWYFATALAKQPEEILPYFTQRRLPVWVHNKAIQKSMESRRIPNETKEYLRTLKIKSKP